MEVIDGLDRSRESFLDAVVKGAFTVPGDGILDFEAIVEAARRATATRAGSSSRPSRTRRSSPPLEMAKIGHKELLRVMAAAGYSVEA